MSSRRQRDADVVFATFNNWQNGDFRPWVMRSDDRGRTWVNITGNLPVRSGTWSVVQDHLDGDLLFVGTEFGVYFTIDGGKHWVELRGGIPKIQARDLHIQRQWTDLVVGTFGRGVYILDDFSALRDVDPKTMAAEAWLFRARPAPMFDELNQVRAVWGDRTEPNPPYGATLTYHLRDPLPRGSRLVLTISDSAGKQVRRITLPDESGVRRVTWDLRRDPAAPTAGNRTRRPGRSGRRGRRGRPGPTVEAGRYTARLGRLAGNIVTPLGEPQSVLVAPLQR